jgi:protein-L-isoaspartate(D-aspartate) O-methyltransferase
MSGNLPGAPVSHAGGQAYAVQRERMVRDLVAARGVKDQRVLAAMRQVPRHLFVRDHLRSQAYGDRALPIGAAQTISQPYVVARMTELLELDAEHSVLEIGTGSGYQTAVLALLARRVYSLERIAELAQQAIPRMRQLGLDNVKIQVFDGSVGWSEWAPYDRILVTAGAPKVPDPLLDQLAPGGSLLIPEGQRHTQRLVLYRKSARGELRRKEGEDVAFVPLLGRHGWKGQG